jgi:hypothetical protein
VIRRRQVRRRVLELSGLLFDAKDGAGAGHPRRSLVDHDVALERRGFRREVVARAVGGDLHVLVLDRDLARALPVDVLFVVNRIPRRQPDLAPGFRDPELDLERRLRLEARLEGIRRTERVLTHRR